MVDHTEKPKGCSVLWASKPDGRLDLQRRLPSADLAPFVSHYGSVAWDLRTPFVADTLPSPSGRLEIDVQSDVCRAEIIGIRTGRYDSRREGRGQFFVVELRAATLQPLLGASMSSLTDRAVPMTSTFGPRADAWVRALRRARSCEAEFELTEAFLREVIPPMPPAVAKMRDVVERIAVDPALCRVEQVAEIAGLDMRTLQRHFRAYVGIHPKWVIQRYRLQEAAQQLRAAPIALARLAADLGYADQAHFARDFRRVIGRPPGDFVASR